MAGKLTDEELGDLLEIGQRVVSGCGGRGDIASMQEIYLRKSFDEPAFMGLMGVTRTQLSNHATRRLGLRWEQLWHRDRRVRLGRFVRMRLMPAVGTVDEGIMPEATADPIDEIEVAEASDHDLGLNEAEPSVTAAHTFECPALVQGMLRGEVDDARVVRQTFEPLGIVGFGQARDDSPLPSPPASSTPKMVPLRRLQEAQAARAQQGLRCKCELRERISSQGVAARAVKRQKLPTVAGRSVESCPGRSARREGRIRPGGDGP
jgi:hypothetical protein